MLDCVTQTDFPVRGKTWKADMVRTLATSYARLERRGIVGHGECFPPPRYGPWWKRSGRDSLKACPSILMSNRQGVAQVRSKVSL
jgi:hypothetical protein